MLLLVSDANILIDIEEGGLLVSMFSLDFQFIIPDILFVEELSELHAHFLDYGLKQRTLSSDSMLDVLKLARSYKHPSRMISLHCPWQSRKIVRYSLATGI